MPGAYENAVGVSFVDENNIWIASGSGVLHTSNTGVTTFIDEENNYGNQPTCFTLYQNYPNPFNPTTKIKYSIPSVISIPTGQERNLNVVLKVYDVLGNDVATLVNEEKSAGNYEVSFDAANQSSGVYFYQLKVGNYFETKKMILLR